MSRAVASIFRRFLEKEQWRELGIGRGFGSLVEQGWSGCLGLEEVEKVLSDVKAGDVRVIPVGGRCPWTDHMVIATGKSEWHVRNIAQALVYRVCTWRLVIRHFSPSRLVFPL